MMVTPANAMRVAQARWVLVPIALLALISESASLPRPEEGLASVYAQQFDGRRTASGERYDSRAATAAHRTLPLGTVVRVTNVSNGKSTRVRINDRGPHTPGRAIDLSAAAAAMLGIQGGVTRVKIEVLEMGPGH